MNSLKGLIKSELDVQLILIDLLLVQKMYWADESSLEHKLKKKCVISSNVKEIYDQKLDKFVSF